MTTELLTKKSNPFQIVNVPAWQHPVNTYVCRVALRAQRGIYSATAIRRPDLVVEGNSEAEAMSAIRQAYKNIIDSRQAALRPVGEISKADMAGAIERCLLVKSGVPSVSDIDAAYDDLELTDEQSDALLAQRASGSARATIPLVRFARP